MSTILTGNLPFVLQGQIPIEINWGLNLLCYGDTVSTQRSNPVFNQLNGGIGFFLNAGSVPSSNYITSEIPFILNGSGYPCGKSLPFFLVGTNGIYSLNYLSLLDLFELNPWELNALLLDGGSVNGWYFANSLPLFTKGDGIYDGGVPLSGKMNLFVQGGKGFSRSLTLYCKGGPVCQGSLPMFCGGVTGYLSKTIGFHLPSIGLENNTVRMFCRGFIPGGY